MYKKKTSFTPDEKEVLNFIKNYNCKMDRDFNNIRNKLYNFIPKYITGKNITWVNRKNVLFNIAKERGIS